MGIDVGIMRLVMLLQAAISGLIVGGFAQFTASPMDLVKVQLQMEGRRKLEGKPPRVRNAQQAVALIYRQGGIRGLWKVIKITPLNWNFFQ